MFTMMHQWRRVRRVERSPSFAILCGDVTSAVIVPSSPDPTLRNLGVDHDDFLVESLASHEGEDRRRDDANTCMTSAIDKRSPAPSTAQEERYGDQNFVPKSTHPDHHHHHHLGAFKAPALNLLNRVQFIGCSGGSKKTGRVRTSKRRQQQLPGDVPLRERAMLEGSRAKVTAADADRPWRASEPALSASRPKLRVTFHQQVEVVLVASREELFSIKADIWWGWEDYLDFRRESISDIQNQSGSDLEESSGKGDPAAGFSPHDATYFPVAGGVAARLDDNMASTDSPERFAGAVAENHPLSPTPPPSPGIDPEQRAGATAQLDERGAEVAIVQFPSLHASTCSGLLSVESN